MNIKELNEYKSIRNMITFSEYSKRLNILHKNNSLKNFIKNKEYILTLRKNNKKENKDIDLYINKLCKERQLTQEKTFNNNLSTSIKNENEFSIFDNILPKKKLIKQNILNIFKHNKIDDQKIFSIKERKRKYPILISHYSPNYNSIYKHSPKYKFNSEKRFVFNDNLIKQKIKKKFKNKQTINNCNSEINTIKNNKDINTIFSRKNIKYNKSFKYLSLNDYNKNKIIKHPFKNSFLMTSLSHNELPNISTSNTSENKLKYKNKKNNFEKLTTIS